MMSDNRKKSTLPRILLYILSAAGALFSAYLVVMESYDAGFCPLLFDIPACYPVLVSYILVLVSLFINRRSARYMIFYLGAVSGLAIAVWFSAERIMKTEECPVILGIPMCYASLALFLLILALGVPGLRKKRS